MYHRRVNMSRATAARQQDQGEGQQASSANGSDGGSEKKLRWGGVVRGFVARGGICFLVLGVFLVMLVQWLFHGLRSGSVSVVFNAKSPQVAAAKGGRLVIGAQRARRKALPYAGASGNDTLAPLPPYSGVDEVAAFLAEAMLNQKSWRSPCTIPRLDRATLTRADFASNWQDVSPFIFPNVSESDGSALPWLDLLALKDAEAGELGSEGYAFVVDSEYGTLTQRRDFLRYWVAPAFRSPRPELSARIFGNCGRVIDGKLAPEELSESREDVKRSVYGRLGEELHGIIEPVLRTMPLWQWHGKGHEAKSWISTAGARTPAHVDQTRQFLTQLRGHKFVLVLPPAAQQSGMLERVAEYPGLPDPAVLPALAEPGVLQCVLGPGDTLYLPQVWVHDVFTLTDSFTAVVRWDKPLTV